MKKQLMALNFSQTDIRVIERNGEPWWVLNDICAVLEIKNPRDAAGRLEDYQKDNITRDDMHGFLTVGNADSQTLTTSLVFQPEVKGARGGAQYLTVVNESGVYSLINRSRVPAARAFNRWLTTEVLPSIRKHGFYDPSRLSALAATADSDAADEAWNGGHDKSQLQRFSEEITRFEQRNNTRFTKAFDGIYPRTTLKAIDTGLMTSLNAFTKDKRWLYLLSAGFDLTYIFWGDRTLTTTERQIRDALRTLGPEQRRDLLLQAQHMAQPKPPLLTDEGDA